MTTAVAAPSVISSKPSDPLQLIDVDHVQFYVGNAKQAAFFYANCFGFQIDQVSDPSVPAASRRRSQGFLIEGRASNPVPPPRQ